MMIDIEMIDSKIHAKLLRSHGDLFLPFLPLNINCCQADHTMVTFIFTKRIQKPWRNRIDAIVSFALQSAGTERRDINN